MGGGGRQQRLRWGGLGEWSEHGADLTRVKVRVKENQVETA